MGKTVSIRHDILDGLFEAPRDDDQTHARDNDGAILRTNPNVVGVISDTFDHTNLVVLPFIVLLTRLIGAEGFTMNKNEHWLRVNSTGAELRWYSAESPRAAQGQTFSRVYLDESQNISDEFWTNLRPALGARMARVFAFGTPDTVEDCTWFEGLYLRGQSDDEPEYYSCTVPCTANKWLPAADIRDAIATQSEREFRMKYLGQWVKHEGAVFRNIEACFTGGFIPAPLDGHTYVMGLDLAKHEDYTVAYIIDDHSRAIVHRWRINLLDYVLVAEKVADLYRKFHCRRVMMDATGVGDPVYDMLRRHGLHVQPFVFGQKTKERLVSTLAREIEHKRLVLPKEDTQLLRELRAFSRTVTKAGNVQYSAPINFHDDTVMALGLAVLCAQQGGSARVSNYMEQ